MSGRTIFLSIVVPVFNEAAVLPRFFEALDRVRRGSLRDTAPHEIILVDDGSQDASWEMIRKKCHHDPAYVGVKLSRNFGHQLALAAGMETARGEVMISMDADLQDPPEVIPDLLAAYYQGFDVVYATRADRGSETWFKRVTARWFYRLIDKMSGVSIPHNTGDFRLMSRRVLTELSKLRESHRFLRGLVPWVGFPQTQVIYNRGDRAAGKTHYPVHKMLRLAADGIASMSQAPLRLAYVVSLGLFAIFIGYIVYVFIDHAWMGGELEPGWTSIMAAITIFGTIQILLLGVFGEYLGRVYEQVKNRPLYIVQEIQRAKSVSPSAAKSANPNPTSPVSPLIKS